MADFEKVYSIKFNTADAHRRVKRLQDSIRKIKRSVDSAEKAINKGIGKRGTAAVNKVEKASRRAAKSVDKIGKSARRSGQRLKVLSQHLMRRVALPLGIAGTAAVKFSVDFNKGLANVASLLPGQTEKIEGFKVALKSMAAESGKSLEDLTSGLYETVSAFGDTGNSIEQLKVASMASVAGLSTTKEALSLLSATTKGYGDTSTGAMQKVSDLAFMTVKLGQTTFPELASSMGRVIPLAAQMNTRQEELFGTMATLTGVTGTAAEVSTQLASIYSAFLKPTEAMTAASKKYGFETGAAMLKSVGLRQSLINLNEAVDGNEQKMFKLLRRKEANIAATALLGGQSDTYRNKLLEMEKSLDATSIAYDEQTKGINKTGHTMAQTRRRLVNMAISIGDKLLPVVGKLLDRFEPLIKYLENIDEEAIDFVLTAGKLAIMFALGSKLMVGMNAFTGMIGSMGGAGGSMAMASTGVVGLLGKFNLLTQALLGGLAAGTALSQLLIEPASKKRAGRTGALAESDISAANVARTGSTADVQRELSRVQGLRAEQKRTAGGASISDVIGGVGAAFGLVDESPGQKRRRAQMRSEKAIGTLQSELQARELESYLRGTGSEFGVSEQTAQTSSEMVNNITINAPISAPGGDLKAMERGLGKALQRATQKIAPASN
jgi:TP901 family phage tail tape measure protein